MNIGNISAASGVSSGVGAAQSSNGDAFDKVWNLVGDMNQNQLSANEQIQNVLLGKSDDASSALIALEKNEQALSYATIVRDKLIEGTKKILDMQL